MTASTGAGCSRQEAAWRESRAADSVAAYEAYLQDFPAGTHAGEAQERLAGLREQREWDRALRLDTPEAFQRYLSGHPGGRHAATARERLTGYLQAQPPDAALPPAVAMRQPGAAGTPIAAAAGDDECRLQLGAFAGGEDAARLAWSRLRERHGDLLAGLTPRVDIVERDGRSVWRLQAGGLSEARALQVCASLASSGEACMVVHD